VPARSLQSGLSPQGDSKKALCIKVFVKIWNSSSVAPDKSATPHAANFSTLLL
jgi:hypothetical protein